MIIRHNTLVEFENDRYATGYIPPAESNSFYDIGESRIDLFTIRDDPEDCRFDLYVEKGILNIGNGIFNVSGDIVDSSKPYHSFTILEECGINIDKRFIVNSGNMDIHGTVNLNNGSHLISNNGGSIIFHPDSILNVFEGSQFTVENGAKLEIYGTINIHLTLVNLLTSNPNIYIDTAAVFNVSGIDLGDRDTSVTDYIKILQDATINKYTRNEYNTANGRLGYIWRDGDTSINSRILELDILYGDIILGDFKASILGLQETLREDLLVFESIKVVQGATLYITDSYKGQRFLNPNLYLGIIIGNVKRTANMRIDGTTIVSGENSSITLDRKATLYISDTGVLELKNDAKLVSAYNDDTPVLFIYGTLIIDKIEQITSLNPENIILGENAKIIINNNYKDENHLLFSTPNGIHYSDLYRLFEDRLDQVEYHVQPNTGIKIDQYFEYYSRDMVDWYGGVRIEKAIFNKMIIWHSGAYIELDHDIIPWADMNSSLLHASRIFKSYGSFDNQKLQDVVERLKYAGSGDIRFRFVEGDLSKEILLIIQGLKVNTIVGNSINKTYTVNTTGNGELFLHNLVSTISLKNIVNDTATKVSLADGDTMFVLDE